MGILDSSKITVTITDNYQVGRAVGGVYMNFYNYVPSLPDYIHRIDDNSLFLGGFSKVLNNDYTSILIGGLGLGAVPQYIAENHLCETIDIIELNPDLINTMSGFEVYDPKINIIEGDIFTYTPVQGYDVIMFDIWSIFSINETFNSTVETLSTKYNTYLNQNGFLYFPILGVNGGQDTFPKI
jgi:hypothetical protein